MVLKSSSLLSHSVLSLLARDLSHSVDHVLPHIHILVFINIVFLESASGIKPYLSRRLVVEHLLVRLDRVLVVSDLLFVRISWEVVEVNEFTEHHHTEVIVVVGLDNMILPHQLHWMRVDEPHS